MLMHPYDSQKSKALTCVFLKQAPKSIVFSKTFSLFDYLSFVIIIDSVGYEAGLRCILADVFGTHEENLSTALECWAKREDKFKMYIHEHQKTKREKIWCTMVRKLHLKEQCYQNIVAKRKGDKYKTGVGIHVKSVEKLVTRANRTQAKWTKPTKCKCGLTDHLCISYKLCELNPKNIALAIEAAKAMAQGVLFPIKTTNEQSEKLKGEGVASN